MSLSTYKKTRSTRLYSKEKSSGKESQLDYDILKNKEMN